MKRIAALGFSMTLITNSVWADMDVKSLCRETALKYAHYADTDQRDKFGALFTKNGTLVTTAGARKPAEEASEAPRPARTTPLSASTAWAAAAAVLAWAVCTLRRLRTRT